MPAVPTTPRVKLRSTSRRVPRERTAGTGVATETENEPTMRLSRAIAVMLLLHIVAVGGFFASSLVKERDLKRSSSDAPNAVEAEDSHVPANVRTDSTTRPPAERSEGSAKPHIHVVRFGETLPRIASENGVTLEALIAANGVNTATNRLQPGQELKLPEKSPDPATQSSDTPLNALNLIEGKSTTANAVSAATASASTRSGNSPRDSGKVYTVGKGENAYTIAQKFKVSYDALLRLNQIDDPKKLKPGQKLRVPLALKPKGK